MLTFSDMLVHCVADLCAELEGALARYVHLFNTEQMKACSEMSTEPCVVMPPGRNIITTRKGCTFLYFNIFRTSISYTCTCLWHCCWSTAYILKYHRSIQFEVWYITHWFNHVLSNVYCLLLGAGVEELMCEYQREWALQMESTCVELLPCGEDMVLQRGVYTINHEGENKGK